MTGTGFTIRKIHLRFFRDDRDYCIFSLSGNSYDFLYFSHREKPLRALFYGDGFLDEIPRIRKDPVLCIECGLGTRILGGVSLDGPDCIRWNCSRDAANGILSRLRELSGREGDWIAFF